MGASRNQESTRQEKDGVVYYDRGILTGKDGRRYQRYAIKTHFVQPGEDQAELVRRYVLPLYQPGDCLSFTAKVMGMCTNNVRTLEDTHPGFWAKTLAPFAGHNSTGIGMHQPYKMQLVIEICGLPRVLFAAAVSAVSTAMGSASNPSRRWLAASKSAAVSHRTSSASARVCHVAGVAAR